MITMNKNIVKEQTLIVDIIQTNLSGKIDASSNFNPCFLAEAILQKLNFGLTLEERKTKEFVDVVQTINNVLNDIDTDMDTELSKLGSEEKMLANFIRGQKTACEKIRESLKDKL
jgi:hypothetical protein